MGTGEKQAEKSISAGSAGRQDTAFLTLAGVVSCIAVVMLHTNGCFWTFSATARYWKTANLIDAGLYFAVPVFFMISASTLLDYNRRYGLGTYFRKRITKTVIPYVFWSLIGVLFQVFYLKNISLSDVTPAYILDGLGNGSLVSVYWFFIPLFSVYLSIPLFAAVPEEKRKTVYTYLAAASFLLCSLIPFLTDVFELPFSTSLTIGVGAGYLFFLPAGYLISHYDMKPALRRLIYILGLFGLILHITGTYFYSMEAGAVDRTFKGYTNVPSILYSVAVFTFFRQFGNRIMQVRWISRFVNFLSRYTFSIYLLHWFIMKAFVKVFSADTFSIFFRLLAPVPIIAMAVLLTWLIRKIPVVRKLLP